MKISVIGGGSWGTTLANVLSDNGNEVLIYARNNNSVDNINNLHLHSYFQDTKINVDIKATNDIKKALVYSSYILIAVPSSQLRTIFKIINKEIKSEKFFINVAKGIEPNTLKTINEVFLEEINKDKIKGYCTLSGPSHAEEVIKRKLTLLVAASNNLNDAKFVQKLFSNNKYIRVYTSTDLKGVEVSGAIKNAIALISGILKGIDLGENSQAALISRGIYEIIRITTIMGGKKETVFGLSGIGDLIVTSLSNNSRNYQAGIKIGKGMTKEEVIDSSNMVIEGIRAIEAGHQIAKKYNLDLPIIETAYNVLYKGQDVKEGISLLMNRDLKNE